MLSITPTIETSQEVPQGIRVLRENHDFLYTVDQLDQCCAAHPNGCGFKRYCLREFATRSGQWTFLYKVPEPTRHRANPADWMPALELEKTLRSIQRFSIEEG